MHKTKESIVPSSAQATNLIVYSRSYYLLCFLQSEQTQGVCIMLYIGKENGVHEYRVKHNQSQLTDSTVPGDVITILLNNSIHQNILHSCRTTGDVQV